MKTIRFGVIGCGLMGREFASTSARWCHLLEVAARPQIVAACSAHAASQRWFQENVPTLTQTTLDYRELLQNPEVEAVYAAVPHHLHREIYCAALEAGKHLMGEKPFGIDREANEAILAVARRHAEVFVRCSSEFPFFPGIQRLCDLLEQNAFGRIIEANTGLLHSSDLDPNKPINWKRMVEFNGEYGVLGDLGMHALHVPLRAGWQPRNLRAVLSKIVTQRPDDRGNLVPCTTWDNGSLLLETLDPQSGEAFPWTVRLQRIAPGHRNTWYIEVLGTLASARWSSANLRLLEVMRYIPGGEQKWEQIQTGYEPAFKAMTGPIFEFGFGDSLLQMWAAFLHELIHGKPLRRFAGCVTPEETRLSHEILTAAVESQRQATTVALA